MSQLDSFKSRVMKNPVMFISILQIVMLFFRGYKYKDEFLDMSTGKNLMMSAFENFGGISIVFRVFIVISPIVILLCLLTNFLGDKQGIVIKIGTVLGAIGSVWHVFSVWSYQDIAKMDDITISVGLGLWVTVILYVAEIYFVFLKDRINKKES